MALAAALSGCVATPPPAAPGVRFEQRATADPKAVAAVRAGALTTANAAWWGFDPADSTAALQAAIDSGARTVLVPDMGAPWQVNPIRLAGSQEIIFEKGAVVQALAGAFRGSGDRLFSADNVADLILRGGGATLRMRKADYQREPYRPSEWRHAVALTSCRNVLIEGLRIESSGGDGIYVGASRQPGAAAYCRDVTIRRVTLLDHHRQGISVVSARALLVEDCYIAGTSGTAPQAGVDFEPNRPIEYLEDCVLRGCTIEANAGAGVQIYLHRLDGQSPPVSITLESCVLRGNVLQLWITSMRGAARGLVRVSRCRVGWPRIVEAGELAVDFESPK